jgi:two-component system, chemotaxis family, protein-glutamate methylesterase/glutaminase
VIRVLIADDSRSFRAILRAILERAPELEVVGEAGDGGQAVALTAQHRPDVVTMDVRMPGKDGLAAIEEIMARHPTPIVVVSAEVGPEHQETSFRALALGAVEVLRKPSSTEAGRFEREAEDIRLAVRAVAGLRLVTRRGRVRAAGTALTPVPGRLPSPTPVPPAPAARPRAATPLPPRLPPAPALPALHPARLPSPPGAAPASGFPLRASRAVGVAASTGGPPALARLLGALPPSLPAAVLVVQHIASGFERGLVHWLAQHTALTVKLAEHGEPLRNGTVYLAPEGRHLTALVGTAFLEDGPPVRGFRPSGNTLLHSLAREYGPSAVGVILTGMGDDGVDGLQVVRQRGGATFAQGPASCVVFGMPREAIERGAAGETLELEEIAPALQRVLRTQP